MSKPSKVLIIGSGPIVIGQACCHSEGAERLKNLSSSRYGEALRSAQGDSEKAQGNKEGEECLNHLKS